MEKPTGIKLPSALPQTLEIDSADFHIPSAPEKTANFISIPKPERSLPQSDYPTSFRLILRLEKTEESLRYLFRIPALVLELVFLEHARPHSEFLQCPFC